MNYKRTKFRSNIKAMTRSRSLSKGMMNWQLLDRINLRRGADMACELCGTHFRRGAWVIHPRHRPRIPVGGSCLQALLLQHWPKPREVQRRRATTKRSLIAHYGYVIHPGDWIKWVVENAPRRLAREATELEACGMTATDEGLRRLIRFHDATRLYPIEALIPDVSQELFRGRTHATLKDARDLIKSLNRPQDRKARVAAESTSAWADLRADEWLHEPGPQMALRRLDDAGRRTVAALFAIGMDDEEGPICDSALAERWPLVGRANSGEFCWHPKLGLGYLEEDEELEGVPGDMWLVCEARHATISNLRLWRRVNSAQKSAVAQLEALAFGRPILLAEGLRPTGP